MEFKEIKQSAACGVQKITSAATEKVKNSREQSTKFVNRVMDVNGDGQIGIEDVIIMGLRVPGICVDWKRFIRL